MYLIFDTETTGFIEKSVPFDHPSQARVVQLAALLLDKDFNEMSAFHTIMKLGYKDISPGAQNIHHISKELCNEYGMNQEVAITTFIHMLQAADFVVAHNIKFDAEILNIENNNCYGFGDMFAEKKKICTMNVMTPVMKLPGKIPGKYKWPKLREAYEYINANNNLPDLNEHDAMSDCKGCLAVLKFLINENHLVLDNIVPLAAT